MESDQPFKESIVAKAPDRSALARKRILEDAGGSLPVYEMRPTDLVIAPFLTQAAQA
jgi:hypothetical protein